MEHDHRTLDAVCLQHLYFFIARSFNELHAGEATRFKGGWHLETISSHLEKVWSGDLRNLIITMPPRNLKSISASVAFTAFILAHDPGAKIIVASYGDALAAKLSDDSRKVMESADYRRMAPQTRLAKIRKNELVTTHGGYRLGVSNGGAVTGFGADYIIIDDPSKADEAASPLELQNVKDFYDRTLYSRLNEKGTGRIIIVMQRLHEDDLVGHLLQKGTFTHLNLRAIAEEDEQFETLFGQSYRRKRGEPLCAEHESLESLAETRKQIGEAFFSAQYQQNPIPPGGNRIKWEWFDFYDEMPERSWFQNIVHSWDTAMSAEASSDYSVCLTWGFREGLWYLLDVHREKYDYPDLVKRAKDLVKKWQPDMIIIEDGGTGKPLYQVLRKAGLLRKLNLMKPADSKILRLEAQTVKLEQRGFLLPKSASWLAAFKHECEGFPKVRHDDQVDALSQFLASLDTRRGHVLLNPVRGAVLSSRRPAGRLVDYSFPI